MDAETIEKAEQILLKNEKKKEYQRKHYEKNKETKIATSKQYYQDKIKPKLLEEKKLLKDQNNQLKIIATEENLSAKIEIEGIDFPVKIHGNVDRVDELNGEIRIIDYKSGKVEQRHLRINDFDGLTTSLKNEKVIQLLCYAMMFQNSEMFQNQDIQAGINSFKNIILSMKFCYKFIFTLYLHIYTK